MLDGMTRLLPMADVGFVGLRRDEESLVASTYADRLPTDLTDRDTFVLDPMLATGGTLATVISMLVSRGAASVTAICLLAAPEGLRRVEEAFAGDEVRVVTAAVDERLEQRGYIVPGLGDAGDRLFGRSRALDKARRPGLDKNNIVPVLRAGRRATAARSRFGTSCALDWPPHTRGGHDLPPARHPANYS